MIGKKFDFHRKNTLRDVLKKFTTAGLETKCFYSRDRDKVFVKVRASYDRLRKQADFIGMKLKLDETEVWCVIVLGPVRGATPQKNSPPIDYIFR